MQFTFQALTWGFLIALVPLLIHLINLMRHRRVKWAAMEFLMKSYKKHRKWVWLKQLLLLLLRMAIVAVIVAMLAQWDPQNTWFTRWGGRVTHHFVVVDDSYSMADSSSGQSSFETAMQVLTRLGNQTKEMNNQRFTLVRFSRADQSRDGDDGEVNVELADMMTDLNAELVDRQFDVLIEDKRGEFNVTQFAVGPEAALGITQQLLRQDEDQYRIVYLLSDFREREWESPSEIRTQLQDIKTNSDEIHLVDCSVAEARPNLAITSLEPADATRAAGVPLFVNVQVRNYGQQIATRVPLKLKTIYHPPGQLQSNESSDVVGQEDELPTVILDSVQPGETITKRFQVYFPEKGQHVVHASLPDDPVTTDNTRWSVIDFSDGDKVLIVDGADSNINEYFLTSIFRPGQQANTGIVPVIQPAQYLRDTPPESLGQYSAIYLMDIDRLDSNAIDSLEKYVAAGGGLSIFLGERFNQGFYNDSLYKSGNGLLPMSLAGATLLADPLQEATPHLDVLNHPIFEFYQGERNPLIRGVKVRQYVQVDPSWTPPDDSTAQYVCNLHNGAPLAIEHRFGEGTVVCFTTSLAPDWNNWAQDPSLVVVILELHSYITTAQRLMDNKLVGSQLQLPLNAAEYDKNVRFLQPGDDPKLRGQVDQQATTPQVGSPVLLASLGQRSAIGDQTETHTSGIYDALYRDNSGQYHASRFALNVNPLEGNLTIANRQQLLEKLEPVKVELRNPDDYLDTAIQQAGGSASTWLMWLLIIALAGEQLLAFSASYHPAKGGKS